MIQKRKKQNKQTKNPWDCLVTGVLEISLWTVAPLEFLSQSFGLFLTSLEYTALPWTTKMSRWESALFALSKLWNLALTEKNPECVKVRSHGGLLSCWDAGLSTALSLSTSPAVGSFLPYFHQPDHFSSLFLCLLSLFPYPSAFQLCQVWLLNCYIWDHMLWSLTHLSTSFWRHPPWLIVDLFTAAFSIDRLSA